MKRVEFLFDYASPFAFIANQLLGKKLAGAEIQFQPVYVRALESFEGGFPFRHKKTLYFANDLRRCAEYERVVMNPPATFPINGLYALRGALIAQKLGVFEQYHSAMFRAAWVEARELSSAASVANIARELNLPQIAEQLDDPAIKAELRQATETAAARGAFGVPTFFVGEEMFWGQDRMHHVQQALT